MAAEVAEVQAPEVVAEEAEVAVVGGRYLAVMMDPARFGFRRVADRILVSCLDYHSFVAFKRSCRFAYDYIARHELEGDKLRRKLARDWRKGVREMKTMQVPSSATCALVFDSDRRLLCSVDKRVFVFCLANGDLELTFCRHQARVSCLALEGELAVSGDLNGNLIVWEWRSGRVIVEKQMFGRIEALRLRNGYLATGHFSKSYDAGCISIRKFNLGQTKQEAAPPPQPPPLPPSEEPAAGEDAPAVTPSASPTEVKKAKTSSSSSSSTKTRFSLELPVCFSWFGDLFPVADLDFNSRFMVVLQWNVTFRGVNTGSASVYPFDAGAADGADRIVNLSKAADTTFSCCRFVPGGRDDLLVTGEDGGAVHLWQLTPGEDPAAKCLRILTSHTAPIHRIEVCDLGARMISRDIQGDTIVWDLETLKGQKDLVSSAFDEELAILAKETTRSFTTHTALAISSRWFAVGCLDTSVHCYDVWRDS